MILTVRPPATGRCLFCMRDLTDPRSLYLKAALFFLAGALSASILLLDHPHARTLLLLVTMIWCFARLYYFAFYVVGRYVDPSYRFSGLASLLVWAITHSRAPTRSGCPPPPAARTPSAGADPP